jgi:hypothetical protein
MPYNDVVKELDISDAPIEDWDWDRRSNPLEGFFGGTLEDNIRKHIQIHLK